VPHSQAAKEAAGKGAPPAKKTKMSQPALVVGQSFLTNFLKAAPSKPPESVPSPHVFEGAKKESLQEFADRMAKTGEGDQTSSKPSSAPKAKGKHGDRGAAVEVPACSMPLQLAILPSRKALHTLTSSQANSSTRGAAKAAHSQASAGTSGAAAPRPSATAEGAPPQSEAAEHGQGASAEAAGARAAHQTKPGVQHSPERSEPARGPPDNHDADDTGARPSSGGASDGVGGSAAGKRAAREEGESPPTKSQGADTQSAEKSALSKLSPNSSSMQSLSSPQDRAGSGKEDISPSQTDIYGLFANDDEEEQELAMGHDALPGANARKRARAAPAAQSSFIFAVPRPPSSIVSEGELAATRRPIMGSSTCRGAIAPAPSVHAKSKKGPKKGSLRCSSLLSSEMRNLMNQLEKQASGGASDDASASRSHPVARDSCGVLQSLDSPCTEKGPAAGTQSRRASDLLSTPQGSSSALATPATLPMNEGEFSCARTAHLTCDSRSADATTMASETDSAGPCVCACMRACAVLQACAVSRCMCYK